MTQHAGPYREAADPCTSDVQRMAPVPRPVSRAEVLAVRTVVWTPSAFAAYAAIGSVAGCRPLGRETPGAVLLGILWGVVVYAGAHLLRSWAMRAYTKAQQALRAGELDAAEAAMRRICAVARAAPDYHAAALGGLGHVAMRRGDLGGARSILESTLGSPWLVGAGRASLLYTLSSVHALSGHPDVGHRTLAQADAIAPKRLAVWSSVVGAHLAIAEGAFDRAAAKLEVASNGAEDLQSVGATKLVQALWAFSLQRSGGSPEQVRAHLLAASPLSRRQVGHYLRAWPDLDAFLVEQSAVVVD